MGNTKPRARTGDPARKVRLQTFRSMLNLRQTDVARRAGLCDSSISLLEGGWLHARYVDKRRQFAAGYGLSVEDFGRLLDGSLTAEAAVKIAVALDDAA